MMYVHSSSSERARHGQHAPERAPRLRAARSVLHVRLGHGAECRAREKRGGEGRGGGGWVEGQTLVDCKHP